MKISIRRGRRSDTVAFLGLLTALANFEKLEPPDEPSRHRLVEDIFARRRLGLFVATAGADIVGYALYFYSYSSFLARPTLYLEDIFVPEDHRGRGIGSSLFHRCLKEAESSGCGRMEWAVLTWNLGAIGFYEKVGARKLDEWHVYRLTREQFGIAAEALRKTRHAKKRPRSEPAGHHRT
ncbi:MAG TPA: GNAT family N-acetyltransferase [Nitrososphaerales archaeon]|nr:GNAT family N-acetyltransferase [Nitrososphaerales archaeon]